MTRGGGCFLLLHKVIYGKRKKSCSQTSNIQFGLGFFISILKRVTVDCWKNEKGKSVTKLYRKTEIKYFDF